MTPEREARIRQVVACRQLDLTLILENVHDPHNIGAVLRTADAVGLREVFVLYTEPHLQSRRLQLGSKTASGALPWIDVHYYTDLEACFSTVKKSGRKIWSTGLGRRSKSLYELDLTAPIALLFGNEHEGVSEEASARADGHFIIPQSGMVQSLNISVACAVTLYEAFRQRQASGRYEQDPDHLPPERQAMLQDYFQRHETKYRGGSYPPRDKTG